MEKPAPVQELVVRATGLTGTIVGGGVLVQLEDGVTGLARVGHRMGSVEVLGMGSVLEAGPAQGMVMGLEVVALMAAGMGLEVVAGMVLEVGALMVAGMVLEVVALMVAGMVLEVAPVILVVVAAEVEEVAVALVAMGHPRHPTPNEEPAMGDGSPCVQVLVRPRVMFLNACLHGV
ncbi:hypothetical protein OIU79_025851 [Salix purpurea]|uniref:Uncharacterized protein n=1 Tax=Salix purpurea TaxID=77065 RepID=A0A9Q1A7T2_SALPP|nr:hypothetical protein OIU79_025851 [Salix purpurea]